MVKKAENTSSDDSPSLAGHEADGNTGKKITLVLSEDVDFLVTISARMKKVSRSALVESLLMQGLMEDELLAPYRKIYLEETRG